MKERLSSCRFTGMEGPAPHGHRAPLLWLLLPFAGGILLGAKALTTTPLPVWLGSSVVACAAACLLQTRHIRSCEAALLAGMICLGAAYDELRQRDLPDWHHLPSRETILDVRIGSEPVFHAASELITFSGTIAQTDAHLTDLRGQRLHVMAFGRHAPPGIARGATLRVVGQLEPLARPDPNRHPIDEQLHENGFNFRLGRARVQDVLTPPAAYARFRTRVADRAREALTLALDAHPVPVAALRAMLLGERDELGSHQESLFIRSGTMHLFAISGLHIGVIAGALHGFLRLARLGRWPAFVVGTGLLAFYVDLIGHPPSAMRAWLMVTCVHLAMLVRAPGNPAAALAASALLVLLVDPRQLFSAGFQMSYTVVCALLLYGLPLGAAAGPRLRPWRDVPANSLAGWQRGWQRALENVASVVALAWSATLIGWIAGVDFFGWFTPVGLLANLVLIPAASLVIIGGFLAMVAGLMGAGVVAVVFNHASALVLLGMHALLDAMLRLPGVAAPAEFRAGWIGPLTLATMLVAMVFGYLRNWQGAGGFLLPVGIAVVVLVTGVRFV